jgi:hypothetical protein
VPAELRQLLGEAEHVVELLAVALFAPLRVVEVLLASRGVDPGRLEVPSGIGADPHVLPRGRDHELLQPQDLVWVADRVSVRVDVAEAPAAAHPREARA